MCRVGFLAGQNIEKRGSQYTVASTTFVDSKAGSEAKILEPASRIRILRIRMFLCLLDPDPLQYLFARIRILPSTSKNMKKNLDFYCFVTSL